MPTVVYLMILKTQAVSNAAHECGPRQIHRASQSFAHGELTERVILAIIEHTTNPEFKCVHT